MTGGIGSGKSTLCNALQKMGATVFNADFWAKRLMTEDPTLRAEIRQAFGEESYTDSGDLNREYISSIVFNDESALQELNSLVHPAVFRAFEDEVSLARARGVELLVYEAALLTDRPEQSPFHVTVVVDSPPEIRRERVVVRDGVDGQQVAQRMARQPTRMEYFAAADYVVLNDKDTEALESKAGRLVESIVNNFIPALLKEMRGEKE